MVLFWLQKKKRFVRNHDRCSHSRYNRFTAVTNLCANIAVGYIAACVALPWWFPWLPYTALARTNLPHLCSNWTFERILHYLEYLPCFEVLWSRCQTLVGCIEEKINWSYSPREVRLCLSFGFESTSTFASVLSNVDILCIYVNTDAMLNVDVYTNAFRSWANHTGFHFLGILISRVA